jgi:hypothetical protein
MKKAFIYTYLLIAGLLLAGCSQDNDGTEPTPADGMAQVRLRLSVAGSGQTRAWTDTNATDAEMMNIWVVVITNNSNVVEKVLACKPTGNSREIDPITELPLGTHNFYSFANMSVETVASMLGISVTMPTLSSNDVAYESTAASGTVDADKAVTVNGNGFAALTSSDNNGFGSYGIPMSNVQSATIHNNTTMDLVVVRMMAKMKISVTNATGSAQYIKYASISNVTNNVANNLMLLPTWTSATGKDNMTVVQHGDLQPHLNGTPATTELTIPGLASTTPLADDGIREVTFYINECKRSTDFELTIGLGDASSTQEYRYALIDNQGATSDDNDKWDYIARNDYRIIPIILDDYKLELIPYDFPPIGVYPVSVSEIDTENHVYNFTFHDYGHFHLLPRVTKTSDNNSPVAYSATTPSGTAWTLNTDWAATLKTAAFKGDAWLSSEQVVANGFYRNQTDVADADEAGGVPVWYANDGTAGPQWDPSASANYVPFIFGYIAEPATLPLTVDRKIYHEFRVKLYVGGEYRRDLIYRYYMTLSMDQMLSPSAARRTHDL